MVRQLWWRRKKLVLGMLRTHLRPDRPGYEAASWWDRSFYVGGVADRTTIAPERAALSAMAHYASVELEIARHLFHCGADLRGARVLDLGSGAGHWIDFYRRAGAGHCTGIEISERCAQHLGRRYASDDTVEIRHGDFAELLQEEKSSFDVVNAIGVMFHVVDDRDWECGLAAIADTLGAGGWLVCGGQFGWLGDVNVQFDATGAVQKRLRSRWRWARTLRRLGFRNICVRRNPTFLRIRDRMPENHLLFARR